MIAVARNPSTMPIAKLSLAASGALVVVLALVSVCSALEASLGVDGARSLCKDVTSAFKGELYAGKHATSKTGKVCVPWSSVETKMRTGYEHNLCRAPPASPTLVQPWCNVHAPNGVDIVEESCDVCDGSPTTDDYCGGSCAGIYDCSDGAVPSTAQESCCFQLVCYIGQHHFGCPTRRVSMSKSGRIHCLCDGDDLCYHEEADLLDSRCNQGKVTHANGKTENVSGFHSSCTSCTCNDPNGQPRDKVPPRAFAIKSRTYPPTDLDALEKEVKERLASCVYNVWHFTWKRPELDEKDFNGEHRHGFEPLTATGCCDMTVGVAIGSVLLHYPEAIVLLWSNDVDEEQFRREVVDSPRLRIVRTNELELTKDTPAEAWFRYHKKTSAETVKWSDLMRYVIMYRFGGSYLDADAVMIKPIHNTFQQNHVPNCNTTRVFSYVDDSVDKGSVPGYIKDATVSVKREYYFHYQNGLLFGFQANDELWPIVIDKFVKAFAASASFFAGGPQDFSSAIFNAHEEGKIPMPHIMPPGTLCYMGSEHVNNDKVARISRIFDNMSNAKYVVLHTNLQEGNPKHDSTMYHIYQNIMHQFRETTGFQSKYLDMDYPHYKKFPKLQPVTKCKLSCSEF
eukprot:m.362865 g.362865  ORF g.362865 m.362865 type:complete len:624 (-) comp21079_c0_seq1:268-2139(-)